MADRELLYKVDFAGLSQNLKDIQSLKDAIAALLPDKKKLKDLTEEERITYNLLSKQLQDVRKETETLANTNKQSLQIQKDDTKTYKDYVKQQHEALKNELREIEKQKLIDSKAQIQQESNERRKALAEQKAVEKEAAIQAKAQIQQEKQDRKQLIETIEIEKKSIIGKRLELNRLSAQYTALSKEERENVNIGGAMLKNIKAQSDELKKLEAQMGNHTREVGHYKTATEGLKEELMHVAHVVASVYSISTVEKFLEKSIELAVEQEKNELKLNSALNGRKLIGEELIRNAEKLQGKTTFSKEEILQQEIFLAAQKRSKEEIEKTIQAAIRLSIVSGQDLNESVKQLNGTYEGVTKGLGRIDAGITKLTKEQLLNGEAVDIVNEKYKQFGNGVSSTAGQMTQSGHLWDELKEKLGVVVLSLIQGTGVLKAWNHGLEQTIEILGDKSIPAYQRFFSIFNSGLSNSLAAQQKIKEQAFEFYQEIYKESGDLAAINEINKIKDQDLKLEMSKNLLNFIKTEEEAKDLQAEADRERAKKIFEEGKAERERIAKQKKAEKEKEEADINSEMVKLTFKFDEDRKKNAEKAKKDETKLFEDTQKEKEQLLETSIKDSQNITKDSIEKFNDYYAADASNFKEAQSKKKEIFNNTMSAITGSLSNFSQISSGLQEMDKIKFTTAQDEKQAKLDRQFKQGLIDEKNYNDKSAALKNEAALQEKQLKKYYADVDFGIKVAQIIADLAMGSSQIWATWAAFPPVAIGLEAILATVSGVNIDVANAQREAVLSLASGGYVSGPGTSTSDSINARLSNGEYVLKAEAVNNIGVPTLNAMNNGLTPYSAPKKSLLNSNDFVSAVNTIINAKPIYVTENNITQTQKKVQVVNNSLKI